MNEIYWITRCDSIVAISIIVATCSFIVFCVALIGYYSDDEKTISANLIKKVTPILVISLLLTVFVPTKKDLLLIYGVGCTIDYIKSNETARQLPNKCIEALNNWVKSLNEK
jgi:hypothetical protein